MAIFKTIVLFGAGIGGIVAARRSGQEGGIRADDPPGSLGKKVRLLSRTRSRW